MVFLGKPTLHLKQIGYNSNAPPAVFPAMNEKAIEAYLNLTQELPPLFQWTEGETFEQLIAGNYV